MLIIAIDALVLIVLLKVVSDDDLGFGKACLISLIAAIGTSLLANVLWAAIGIAGLMLAATIAAAILGAALSWLVGAEIKRAVMMAVIFMFVHLGMAIGVNLMLQ